MFFFIEQIKKLLFIFEKRFTSFIPLIILFLIGSFLELFSLGLLIPYIKMIANPEIIYQTDIGKFIPFDVGVIKNAKNIFITYSILFIIIYTFKSFFIVVIRVLISKFCLKNLRNLQIKLLSSYQNMNYSDFTKRNHSEYIRNIRELSSECMTCLDHGLRILSELIVVFSVVIFLIILEPIPLLAIGTVIATSLILYNSFLKPKAIKYGTKKINAIKLLYKSVDESFKGFKEILILGKQSFFTKFLGESVNEIFKNDLKQKIILFTPRHFLELVIVIFIVVFLATQNFYTGQESNILPIVGVFAVAGLRILPSANIISSGMLMIGYAYPSLNIIYEDLNKLTKYNKSNQKIPNKILINNFKSIEFKNIEFKYPNSSKFVFENLNFSLLNKQSIGIIGETGSGKTTLVDILLGFLEPNKGKISINNKEMNLVPNNWKNKISYLPQEHLIINNTIEKNITLSEDNENIDLEKVKKAIKQANLEKFTNNLPKGFNTIIGEGGVRFSGGQYKKICLARLFYHDKEILIMDEATNSLDKKSEDFVIEEIKKLKGKKTIILISHNHNTLKNCDKIYKIQNQKIVDVTNTIQI
tara:strand:+ start:102 stop:1859 length:1758 start_codon:yes stop_codon:yes gene_type:complete